MEQLPAVLPAARPGAGAVAVAPHGGQTGPAPGPEPARKNILGQWRHDGAPDTSSEMAGGAFGFADLLDIVNPLQHIPIVGSLYRALTGDTIAGPARIAGAALFGGPLGALFGIANAIVAEANGADPGDVLVADLLGLERPADAGGETAVAQAPTPDPVPEAQGKTAVTRPVAAAFAPRPEDQALTGDAALSALFGDLRVGGARAPRADTEPAGGPAIRQVVPASARADGAAAPTHAFTRQMMLGLDRYREMAIDRGGAGRPARDTLDRRL